MFEFPDSQLWFFKRKCIYAFLCSIVCFTILMIGYFAILLQSNQPSQKDMNDQAKIILTEAENVIQEIHTELNHTIPLVSQECAAIRNDLSKQASLSIDIRSITLLSDANFSYCSSIFGEFRTNLLEHNKSNQKNSAYFVPKTGISNKPSIFYYRPLSNGKGILLVAGTNHLQQVLLHMSNQFTDHFVVIGNTQLNKDGKLFSKDSLDRDFFILPSDKYPELSVFSKVRPDVYNQILKRNLESFYWVLGLSIIFSYSVFELIRKARLTKLVLYKAFKNKEFIFFMQPIMDLKQNKCVGFEALIRWRHPKLGILSPAYFLEELIRTKLLEKVSNQLICTAMDSIHLQFTKPCYLSINLESEMLGNNDLIENIQSYLAKPESKLFPFVLEFTERGFYNFSETQKAYLNKLSQLGIHFAIDDFGTGKSNLSHLTQIKFDYLKIDKSFVDAIGKNNTTSLMLESIIELGHKFDLVIIAEGIETEVQKNHLLQKDVYLQQGYLFARPMNPEEASDFLSKHSQ